MSPIALGTEKSKKILFCFSLIKENAAVNVKKNE